MKRHCPLGLHKAVKGLDIVTWKPLLVPKINFSNAEKDKNMTTLDTPVREIKKMVSIVPD